VNNLLYASSFKMCPSLPSVALWLVFSLTEGINSKVPGLP